MVKLSESGALLDQFSFGGDGDDIPVYSVVFNNDFLVLASSSSDVSFDKDEDAYGFRDFWLIYIDEYGSLLWQETLGGADDDTARKLKVFNDTLLIMGASNSNISIDKTVPNYGGYDGWMLQLDIETLSTASFEVSENGISIYPVPIQEKLFVNLEDANLKAQIIELYDNLGRKVLSKTTAVDGVNQQFVLDTSTLEKGSYLIRIIHEGGAVSRTLVK
jgi:hypothetical protein